MVDRKRMLYSAGRRARSIHVIAPPANVIYTLHIHFWDEWAEYNGKNVESVETSRRLVVFKMVCGRRKFHCTIQRDNPYSAIHVLIGELRVQQLSWSPYL